MEKYESNFFSKYETINSKDFVIDSSQGRYSVKNTILKMLEKIEELENKIKELEKEKEKKE